jgi:hypothetical protein
VHPWALRLATDLPPVAPDAPVTCGAEQLDVDGWRLDLRGARAVDLRLRIHVCAPPSVIAEEAHQLPTFTNEDGLLAPLLRAGRRAFVARGEVTALARLLGVGTGSTPSGDDVLVGVLAGLELTTFVSPRARRLRKHLAGELRRRETDATTPLSEQMLEAALDGQYAEPVLSLLSALARGEEARAEAAAAAEQLAAIGHTSGRAVLSGIRIAISAAAESSSLTTRGAKLPIMSVSHVQETLRDDGPCGPVIKPRGVRQ